MAIGEAHEDDGVHTPVRTSGRRRRRTRDEAQQEIIDAAARLLTRHPAHEVTVAAVMADTTLTRKAFYVYFRDRADLIAALVRPLRADADTALDTWSKALDAAAPPEQLIAVARAALTSAAHVYRAHGALLRALFWSSATDPELAAVRDDLTAPVVAVAERTIRAARPAAAPAEDPARTATCLVTMNIHSLLTLTPDTPDPDLDALVDTLATIWQRTLYDRHRDP